MVWPTIAAMTEQQAYEVIRHYDGFELRHYPDYVLVR